MNTPHRNRIGFSLYLVFTVSWFLHLTARVPALGTMRLDLLLVGGIIASILVAKSGRSETNSSIRATGSRLMILILYAILTIPFVEWPGTVLRTGILNFTKAVVFYYFTVRLVDSEKRLKTFLGLFLACQLFRVVEPVYLHLTTGYWGSFASMANWEYMSRLAGAPSDVINPNGLAFVVLTVVPFAYYLSFLSARWAAPLVCSLPICLYALVLTGSRSGFLGLLIVMAAIVARSKQKVVLLFVSLLIVFAALFVMPSVFKDRYASIVDDTSANAVTVHGRTEGIKKAFGVALRRPLFGHGLGTSTEANANFIGEDKPAHDLYAEIAEELGFIGLIIFISFMVSVSKNFGLAKKTLRDSRVSGGFLFHAVEGMQVWLIMNVLFSFASFGLSSYEWYLFAGLSVAIARIVVVIVPQDLAKDASAARAARPGF